MSTTNSQNDEGHIRYRKCAKCAEPQMIPVSDFSDRENSAMSTTGLIYECPKCKSRVSIRDGGSLLAGILFSVVSALIGWWAFHQGPLWYATHLSYFAEDYYETSFIILDLLAFLFYTGVTLFAVWFIWRELMKPVSTLISNPVSGENRSRNEQEIEKNTHSRKMLALSFFGFPFLVYAPLFGGIWLLDIIGVDLRQNEIVKFAGMAIIFACAMLLAKFYKVSFALIFFGMTFWMAVFVGVVFTLR